MTSSYPIRRTAADRRTGYADPRFTDRLVDDVARVLVEHGYPPIEPGPDHVRLAIHLADFLFTTGDAR